MASKKGDKIPKVVRTETKCIANKALILCSNLRSHRTGNGFAVGGWQWQVLLSLLRVLVAFDGPMSYITPHTATQVPL